MNTLQLLEALPKYPSGKNLKLEKEMKAYIDKKIYEMSPDDLPLCFKNNDPNEIMLLAMKAMEGIHEEGGNNHGHLVELIQETYGTAQGEAYCMGTVMTAIAYAEIYTGILSNIHATEHCMTAWRTTPEKFRSKTHFRCAVVIWRHYDKYGKPTEKGHTGVVEDFDVKSILTIEGNTSPGVGIVREGDGVYPRSRRLGGEGSMKQVGFIKAFSDLPPVINVRSA